MAYPGFETISPDQLRDYMARHREKEYLLIDVRQPGEYIEAHIPGSRLIPLMELQHNPFDLPSDREMVFYCHSGGRSLMAADLAAEAEVTEKAIYNLSGGIMAWDGRTLADYPKVRVFDKSQSLPDLLMTAMDLEKGAYRFYTYVLEKYGQESFAGTMDQLSKAETAHAKSIYRFWEKSVDDPQPFEALFEALAGEILEGGESVGEMLDRVENIEGNLCLNLMELALHIEYSAFDLYRTMAEQADSEAAKTVFLNIAQAEKAHMRVLGRAITECPGV
ncbi:rhodanese-related sulfurtransferase [Desulfonema ishimotonii]|uniref:Rhodanese-related sulfurtransferase n=1 Tax=Desulfonema ishimotonii TaxID=45657 RepID=A0A401FXY0_9BACT|nr:rhodanese-like domain-containing protein [Desulfonema ishimotonii]GBC61806.1 rhodanese-related sulfurtransferase [Desulfonema ishimotonii]